MVSNDDVKIFVKNTKIQDIKYQDANNAAQTIHTWTVPAGKVWSLIRILGKRDSGSENITIGVQGGSYAMQFKNSNSAFQEYEPLQQMIIASGWILSINYAPGSSSTVKRSYLLIDELPKY